MTNPHQNPAIARARFEVLPLGRSEQEAAQLPKQLRLTVTCSPEHGPDRSVEVAARLRVWILRLRERGTMLPVVIGIPGKVARRRLLEMSVRIGVGPSLSFLRKQRGLRNLFGWSPSDRLDDAAAAYVDDPHLNIAGFHYFTFNQLVDTWHWYQQRHAVDADRAVTKHPSAFRGYVRPEESMT